LISVKKVSELTGISVRTLHYYDEIGLLRPSKISENGYRFYDETAIERLQQILIFRELEFPLKDIKTILDSPNFDKQKALEEQIRLLKLKKEHLENVILFALGIKILGVRAVDFSALNAQKLDEYAQQAKEYYEGSPAYSEFLEKSKNRTEQEEQNLAEECMKIFADFGTMRGQSPDSEIVQRQVVKLRDFITENCYECTPAILKALGKMYTGGGDFTKNIDMAGGEGTAELCQKAIDIFVQNKL